MKHVEYGAGHGQHDRTPDFAKIGGVHGASRKLYLNITWANSSSRPVAAAVAHAGPPAPLVLGHEPGSARFRSPSHLPRFGRLPPHHARRRVRGFFALRAILSAAPGWKPSDPHRAR